MFKARQFLARMFNARQFGGDAITPPVTPTGAKGRRLVRWLIEMPIETNLMGEYVWQREEEEILFLGQ